MLRASCCTLQLMSSHSLKMYAELTSFLMQQSGVWNTPCCSAVLFIWLEEPALRQAARNGLTWPNISGFLFVGFKSKMHSLPRSCSLFISCSFHGHVLFLNGSGYPQEGGTLLWEGHPSSPKIIRDAGMLCVNWGHHPFWQNILHVSLITIFLDKIYSTREGFVAKQNNGVHIAALERISNPSSFAKEQDCRSN